MQLRKTLASFTAVLLAAGTSAQSLQLVNVNYPGIYCRFDPSCNVSTTPQSDTYAPTNVPITCVLESRSFPGNSSDSQGKYGYEYRLILNNSSSMGGASGPIGTTVTNILTVDSLTLTFGQPDPFAFAEHASNQVWVVTGGAPVGVSVDSADLNGKRITFGFSPALTLGADATQTTNTCYFGMISDGAPQITIAILSGSTQDPVNGTVPFKIPLNAQAP